MPAVASLTFCKNKLRDSVCVLCWQATAPCPSCSTMIPETSLDCHSCKFAIPFCVVSGKHIVADDYTGARTSQNSHLSAALGVGRLTMQRLVFSLTFAPHCRGWYDTTVCPSCRFEATHSSFTTFIEKNGSCPMCDQEIVLASVRKMEWNPKVSRLT